MWFIKRVQFVLFLFLVFAACSDKVNKPGSTSSLENDYRAMKFIPVTVMDFKQLDGCEYLLINEADEKLQPINLPDTLKVNELKIWIQYNPYKGVGICMAGRMITLTAIKK